MTIAKSAMKMVATNGMRVPLLAASRPPWPEWYENRRHRHASRPLRTGADRQLSYYVSRCRAGSRRHGSKTITEGLARFLLRARITNVDSIVRTFDCYRTG